jgi:DNA (cytosine-5)-methyltransferase 1
LKKWKPLLSYNNFSAEKNTDTVNFVDVSAEMKSGGKPEQEINFIDLFAGAGRLSCGLRMAGLTPFNAVEIMESAVSAYNRNFGTNHKPCDIRNEITRADLIKSAENKHIHLISGGFPCQDFSLAGHRIAHDERNSLYLEMLKIVTEIKPDFVLMENVEGLRSMLGGQVEKHIIADYKAIGYDINVTVLNSADYGVSQIRKRVIFIGNRIGKKNLHPAPILTADKYKTVKDGIERFANIFENAGINHIFAKHSADITARLKDLPQGSSLYKNYSDIWKIVYRNQPSVTVKENHGE